MDPYQNQAPSDIVICRYGANLEDRLVYNMRKED